MRASIALRLGAALVAFATASAAGPQTAGAAFRDCPDCLEMVVIPAGHFIMGTDESEARALGPAAGLTQWERPQRPVTIGYAFALGKYPVTVAEYRRFASAVGPEAAGSAWRWTGMPLNATDPVVNVTWVEATAYADWMSKRTGRAYRLPSEAEWEYAARAGTRGSAYWGDDAAGQAPCADCGTPWSGKRAAPVGRFRPNPFGLYDMLGNVLQWTQDCWTPSYFGEPPSDGSAWTAGDCQFRAARGGDWHLGKGFARAGLRSRDYQTYHGIMLGFRLARAMPGEPR